VKNIDDPEMLIIEKALARDDVQLSSDQLLEACSKKLLEIHLRVPDAFECCEVIGSAASDFETAKALMGAQLDSIYPALRVIEYLTSSVIKRPP
jgi:hypothetical protein